MLVIGHRGAAGYEPENTLRSFKKALELGVDGVEFDVYLVKDSSIVVIHDPILNRTTNGKGSITNKTLSELQNFDAGNGEKIPTLEEVLDLINKKVVVNIELKGKKIAEPVAEIIEKYVTKKGWSYNDFFVSSFNHAELQAFSKLLPQVKVGALIIGLRVRYAHYIQSFNAYSINIWSPFVNKSVVEKAHKNGLKVFVYTVNNKSKIEKMKRIGVDGIISDFPDRVI